MRNLNLKIKTLNFTKKYLFSFIFVLVILNFKVLSFNLPSVFAQSLLKYPIPELGYCRDAKECYLYCEIPQNKAACWSYGKYVVGQDVLGVSTDDAEVEEIRTKAKKYNITFPIPELGNCTGPRECKAYCNNAANIDSCIAFAKKKGFYKEMQGPPGIDDAKKQELMKAAPTELGCNSFESCKAVCDKDPERCRKFGERHGIKGPEEKSRLMEKAQTELGCTSMESCRATCEKNPERCMEFARRHGFDRQEDQKPTIPATIHSTEMRVESTTCRTEEECKNYCKDNPTKCPGFSKSVDYKHSSTYQNQLPSSSFTTPTAGTQYNTTQHPNTSNPPPAQPVP